MTYHATVIIRLKAGILDPEGRAIEGVLKGLDHPVAGVRVNKAIELSLEAENEEEARVRLTSIARTLANPVTQTFTFELKPAAWA